MSEVPADWLAATFSLGRPNSVSETAVRGTMGEVWRLDTDRGAWAVKRQFPWARADRFEIEAAAVDAAVAAGLQTARILRSADGAVEAVNNGRRWRVFSWLDLGPPMAKPLTEERAAQLGALLASLHNLGLTGSPRDVIPWFTARRPSEQWRQLDAAVTRARLPIAAALSEALPGILDLVPLAPAVAPARCVISHCDLTPGNVLPCGDGLALVDWEHAGPIPPAWELGYALQFWALLPEGVDQAAARAMVEAYRRGGGDLAPLEPDAFAGAISAWLNWTVGRVYGALTEKDDAQRAECLSEAARLLAAPLTRRDLQAIVDAVEG